MKDKKRIYALAGVIAAVAVAAGAYLWTGTQPADKAQHDGDNVVMSDSYEQQKPATNEKSHGQENKPAAEAAKMPAEDVLAMTFEGTKTYIVAGSVVGTKNGTEWKAVIRNGKNGKPSNVEFRQDGKNLMTRNDGGQWRPVDEMDQSIFNKICEIINKQ